VKELRVAIGFIAAAIFAKQDGTRWVEAGTEGSTEDKVTKGGEVGIDVGSEGKLGEFLFEALSQDVVTIEG
jgi:hypothetical protein